MRASAPGRTSSATLLVLAAWLLLCPRQARADVGLVVETPTGLLGFLSDVGHASIWLSRGCLDRAGHLRYCEDSPGLVLTSTSYWPNPGTAAIPADLFFLGTPFSAWSTPASTWAGSLAAAYPDVNPRDGSKYLGRAWRRSVRVLRFPTSPEEDRIAFAAIEADRPAYHYTYGHRNCAFYAQTVLQHYFGGSFHGNRVLEFGMVTPRSVERALRTRLRQRGIPQTTVQFRGRFWHRWREPPRNICEAAALDPKYAVPMLVYQPYLYAGFATCYAAIRIASFITGTAPVQGPRSPGPHTRLTGEQQTRDAFASLLAGDGLQRSLTLPAASVTPGGPDTGRSSTDTERSSTEPGSTEAPAAPGPPATP